MKKVLWSNFGSDIDPAISLSGAQRIAKAIYGEVVMFTANTYIVVGDSRSELIYNKLKAEADKFHSEEPQIA